MYKPLVKRVSTQLHKIEECRMGMERRTGEEAKIDALSYLQVYIITVP